MARQPRVLTGKVAAITGGARGIGKETARQFVREGMKVAIGDLDLDLAKKTAEELGPNVIALPLNVTERDSFRAFLDTTEEQLGAVDVLVNNAGIMQLGRFIEEDDATTQRQIDINVNGVLWGMKEILPRFMARNTGHLVNVASTAGKGGFPGGATYCGTKHFVVGVSEAVRAEVRDTAIEVSCVMPVVVKTELASGLQPTRGVKHIEAGDVAEEIVRALKHPKFDVFVPRQIQAITTAMSILPRGGREAIGRALKADKVLDQRDDATRRAYELRAAHSEPGLEPADAAKELTESTG